MNDDRDIVLFRIDRKVGLLMLAALAVVIGGFALAQQLTLTTSYPVPSGIYNQLITTGNSGTVPANTMLNSKAGNTILVPPTNAGGQVGVGTTAPASRLSVAGGVQLGDDAADCTAAKEGTLRVDLGSLEMCHALSWGRITAKLPPTGSYYATCDPSGVCYFRWAFVKNAVGASLTDCGCPGYTLWGTDWISPSGAVCYSAWMAGTSASVPDISGCHVVQDGVTYTW